MDFAKNLLMKYGWKEGQGIGKNKDGIVEPIKANLKFDNAGLCYDKATEFTDHWWSSAYNSAAENLRVENSAGAVALSIKEESSPEISLNNIKKTFHRSSNNTERMSIDLKLVEGLDNTSRMSKNLTDNEIFEACGGRTAHKGARHGLLSLGKLSRIDAQEQQMLEKIAINTDSAQNIFKDWVHVTKKHRKRDEDLTKSLSNLKTEDTAIITSISTTSRAIKKKKRFVKIMPNEYLKKSGRSIQKNKNKKKKMKQRSEIKKINKKIEHLTFEK